MTTIEKNRDLYGIWEEKWDGSLEKDQLTLIGKHMLNAKKRALREMLRRVNVTSVIDVGCGEGHILKVYQDAGLECVGIDISGNAVAVCKKKGLKVHLRALEDERGSYDLVSSDGMLEHFLNFEPLALHMMRISRQYVLLIQPNHGSLVGKTAVYFAEFFRGKSNIFEYNYRINDFIGIFQANDFKLIENFPVFADVFRILLFQENAGKFGQGLQ